MKTLNKLLIFVLFIPFFGYTQESIGQKLKHKIEDFILSKQLDSALYYINKNPENQYLIKLESLINSDLKSLPLNRYFLSKINYRYTNNYKIVSNYINKNIEVPENSKRINKDYVYIKWKQLSLLINDRYIEESNKVYKKLEEYIHNFDNNERDVKVAKLRLKTYPLKFLIIKEDVQNGKKSAYQLINKAKKLNVSDLEVVFTRHLLAFFVAEKNVDDYITTSEKILELAYNLEDKYEYNFLLPRLVNAYIFKQGYEEECLALLELLYNEEQTRNSTYLYYVQIIHTNIKNKELINKVLKKFNAKSIPEFIDKIKPICKNKLTDIDYLGFLDQASKALEYNKNYQKSIQLKNESISLNKDIYSKQLSESLAKQKTEQALKIKEKEIKSEKEKTKLYLVIASLFFFLLVVTFMALRKLRKQSRELSEKNTLVKKSLKEKDLLIKEVHHRVKNNFQLITSLLELQTEEIEDQKVIELLEKGKSRIKSMSLIHQKLYGTESGLIKFDEFVNILVKELAFLYKYNENLELEIHVNEIYFDVDTAIPLALILNELVTNTFKHAFKQKTKNILFIALHKSEKENYELIFKDNGSGLKENFSIKNTKSSGLKLVERLVKQLQGSLEITNQYGANFQILFKDTKTRKEVI